MPIQVQPSVVSDPSQALQQSAQTQGNALGQAWRASQAGQAASAQGLNTALQSAEAQAQQTGENARQAAAIAAQQMQAGFSSLDALLRERRQVAVERDKEQRIVDRQMDKEKFLTHAAVLDQIEKARIAAMDENGKVPEGFDATLKAETAKAEAAFEGAGRPAWAKALAATGDLNVMAVQASRKASQERKDTVDRAGMAAMLRVRQGQREDAVLEGKQADALDTWQDLDQVRSYKSTLEGAVARLPKQADGSDAPAADQAKAALAATAYPLANSLSPGGKSLLEAAAHGDAKRVRELTGSDTGSPAVSWKEARLVYNYLSKFSQLAVTPEGKPATKIVDELFDGLGPDARAQAKAMLASGKNALRSELTMNENLYSADIQNLTDQQLRAADDVAKKTGIDREIILRDMADQHRSMAKPVPPASSVVFTAPTAQTAAERAVSSSQTSAPAEEPTSTEQPPAGAPPGWMSAPAAAKVIQTFGAPPQERADAVKNLAWRVAENRLFVDSVGGDANAADLLRRLAPTAQGARKEAAGMSAEARQALEKGAIDVGYGGFKIGIPGLGGGLGSGGLWGRMLGTDAARTVEQNKARWNFGDRKNLGAVDDKGLVSAMVLAEAVRQGKFSDEEATTTMGKVSPNALKAYSMLEADDKMAKRIIPKEVVEAVRKQFLSQAEQSTKGMTPEHRAAYEELRRKRAAAAVGG